MIRGRGYGLVLLVATTAGAWSAHAEPGSGYAFSGSGAAASTMHSAAQGYLGVDLHDISDEQMSSLKLKDPRGAEITLVDHDAPAGKAGLREHDIVLQMNGTAIEGEDQIRRMLRESAPGKTVVLMINREGQQMTVTVQMANREELERKAWEGHYTVHDSQPQSYPSSSGYTPAPAPSASGSSPHGGNSFIGTILMMPSYTGVMLEPMSSQLAQFFGAATGKGLLVRSVASNSPAAQAGFQAGDVVVRADTKPVASAGDWSKAIKNSHGRSMTIVVLRDKKEATLTLTPDAKRRSSLEEPEDGSERSTVFAHLGFSWLPRS